MKCEIIQDLLPLYVDDVASVDSRAAIDAHFNECQNCRTYLDAFRQEPITVTDELDKVHELKSVKRALRNRVIKISAISALAALVVGVLGMLGIGWYQTYMPYRPGMFTVAENPNGDVDVVFNSTALNANFTSTNTTEVDVEIAGEPMRIIYFHLKGTIYDRFLSRNRTSRETLVGLRHIRTIDDHPMAEDPEQWVEGVDWEWENIPIAAIYYLPADYRKMFNAPEPFIEQARDAGAVLVWQRPGIDLENATPIVH